MSKTAHTIFITFMALIVAMVFAALSYYGASYYNTNIEERFFQENHAILKPSGILGHGLGILGSIFMIIGVSTYMARKRYRFMQRWGKLKHWLEFHIFLCTLGPIMVLFHTSFKFGGMVSISFWSMVAVFLSGIIGRFIYIQIPRTIEGRELSLNEVREMKSDIGALIKKNYSLDEESVNVIVESTRKGIEKQQSNFIIGFFKKYFEDASTLRRVKKVIKKNKLSRTENKKIIELVKNDISLNRKIERLVTMQNLFKYWHVVHLPFALIMLIIMIIHVVVTVAFGFRWIF
jgi:hypothetical protein